MTGGGGREPPRPVAASGRGRDRCVAVRGAGRRSFRRRRPHQAELGSARAPVAAQRDGPVARAGRRLGGRCLVRAAVRAL